MVKSEWLDKSNEAISSSDPSKTKCSIDEFENVGPFMIASLLFPLMSYHVDPFPG